MDKKWVFWIDCGGTFTDIVGISPTGERKVHKLLSHSPHYESAVYQGLVELTGTSELKNVVSSIRLGTTVATNAFLEKKGVPCALLTSLGQQDVLEIRQQNRPDLFELDIQKKKPLYTWVSHLEERVNAQGEVIKALDEDLVRFELERILEKGISSVAVSFMHANKFPDHELLVERVAKDLGFDYISLSHRVSPENRYIMRTETSVIDANLTPFLKQYTEDLESKIDVDEFLYMQSSGDLCFSEELKGYNSLLSGPAGGLVGALRAAQKRGINKIITFDMGGTSTDVALCNGAINLEHRANFHGFNFLSPMVDIHTVAAGGGSILKYDGSRFLVGPESAGANPGPACYRQGGPLTVTDANLFLGRLNPDQFPKVFGSDQNQGLDEEIVKEKFDELSKEVGVSPEEVAEGFLDVAVETMAKAIRKISIERGQDPSDYTLVSFGGAGGQMATRVAERLKIKSIFIHPLSSVLSAYGMGEAVQALSKKGPFERGFEKLKQEIRREASFEVTHWLRTYFLYSKGSDYIVPIEAEDKTEAEESFREHMKVVFGIDQEEEILCETISLKGEGKKTESTNEEEVEVDQTKEGPFKIEENNTTIVVEEAWKAKKNKEGEWFLEFQGKPDQTKPERIESVEMELFYQRFQFIAEQMGVSLKKLAQSVNIKERNDFSCALFNSKGELLSNAPHIPVHLGSMGDSVRAVRDQCEIKPGNSYICNDPTAGGTHLPDVTVVTPFFRDGKVFMWVASRGHHADIGGVSPGSMPAFSKKLSEEGVVISPQVLVDDGQFQEEKLRKLFSEGAYPTRNIDSNIFDIKAKIAANQKGLSELKDLTEQYGTEKIENQIESILSYSEKKLAEKLKDLKDQQVEKQMAPERKICLSLKKNNEKILFDFTGSSPQQESNFNAPKPVLKAAILFVLRSLVQESLPLNDGLFRSIKIKLPEDCFLNPKKGAAVVAGNVETSQSLCDLLFEAFGIKAHSQGTMNNLTFGTDNYQYYETLGGGSGATASGPGASSVQVNMTNSLLTDPEIFENRYPVLIELMGVRHGSGGVGKNRGGNGLIRKLRFLENMSVSFLSQSRNYAPRGIKGGSDGHTGRNFVEERGERKSLEECFEIDVKKEDRLVIETPGGGGFGEPTINRDNKIFCFGSNMDINQIKTRCPSARVHGRGCLNDYRLAYTRYSEKRQGGVADIVPSKGDQVYGVVVTLNNDDLKVLDKIEGGPLGFGAYKRVPITIVNDWGEKEEVEAYEVIDKEEHVEPSKFYRSLVYRGAFLLNAPSGYLEKSI